MSTMQRVLSVAATLRTHCLGHQAVVESAVNAVVLDFRVPFERTDVVATLAKPGIRRLEARRVHGAYRQT